MIDIECCMNCNHRVDDTCGNDESPLFGEHVMAISGMHCSRYEKEQEIEIVEEEPLKMKVAGKIATIETQFAQMVDTFVSAIEQDYESVFVVYEDGKWNIYVISKDEK